MWLLDHNIPHGLAVFLKSQGINCDTAQNRNWEKLRNGELVSSAWHAKFTCVVTKDTLFVQSAEKVIKTLPEMAIVLLTIPQCRGEEYLKRFTEHWKNVPIFPEKGKMLHWPYLKSNESKDKTEKN